MAGRRLDASRAIVIPCGFLSQSAWTGPNSGQPARSKGESEYTPLVSMHQVLDEAAKGGYGVGAFNVNNMEQIQAIMEAARETQSPVIIQASRGARSYSQDNFLYHLMWLPPSYTRRFRRSSTWTTAIARRPARARSQWASSVS